MPFFDGTCHRSGGRFNNGDGSGHKSSHGTRIGREHGAYISNDRVVVTHMFQIWMGEKKNIQRWPR
jgi:hypothetical protein